MPQNVAPWASRKLRSVWRAGAGWRKTELPRRASPRCAIPPADARQPSESEKYAAQPDRGLAQASTPFAQGPASGPRLACRCLSGIPSLPPSTLQPHHANPCVAPPLAQAIQPHVAALHCRRCHRCCRCSRRCSSSDGSSSARHRQCPQHRALAPGASAAGGGAGLWTATCNTADRHQALCMPQLADHFEAQACLLRSRHACSKLISH